MYEYAFAAVADPRYATGLWALLNSIHAYHGGELRIFVFLHGRFPAALLEALETHPLRDALTLVPTSRLRSAPSGCWEAKQQIFDYLMGRARCVCLLDADLVLLSPLDDVFAQAATGKIVGCRDGTAELCFDESYAVYSERLVGGRIPHFNSGFLCLDTVRHWDLAGLWSFASRFGLYSPRNGHPLSLPGWGDQGVLNAIAALLDKTDALALHPQEEWCNSQRPWGDDHHLIVTSEPGGRLEARNTLTGGRQRLLHSSGPKWWTEEGRRHFAQWTGVYECFAHFERVPVALPAHASVMAESHDAGGLRYIGDISRQDAQVLATFAAGARRILEFGVGGSTQVLAQCAPPEGSIVTIDTSPEWIERTQIRSARLGIGRDVTYLSYAEWSAMRQETVDLVFVDGIDELRLPFAREAWKSLRVGGTMLFHDTRRARDAGNVLQLVTEHHLEVERVEMNIRASNISAVVKKVAEPYVDWNVVEGRHG
jgi:predicted O-methyltransferase YrrM